VKIQWSAEMRERQKASCGGRALIAFGFVDSEVGTVKMWNVWEKCRAKKLHRFVMLLNAGMPSHEAYEIAFSGEPET